jgi:CrcB protein
VTTGDALGTETAAEAIAEVEGLTEELAEDRPARWRWRERCAPFVPNFAISVGGVLGANARYLVGDWAAARWGTSFPFGTLLINVSGCLVLGFYLTLVTERFTGRASTRFLVTTGFLGAYTTFSTFTLDTVQLALSGAVLPALMNVLTSAFLGLAAVAVGIAMAHAL